MRRTSTSHFLLIAVLLGASPLSAQDAQPGPGKGRTGLAVVPRFGLVALGSGTFHAELDCESSVLCPAQSSESVDKDYGDSSVPVLELGLLYHLGPKLRLGGGVLLLPTTEAKIERGSKVEFGTELAPLAIVEGVFGDDLAGIVRGFIGPNFLFEGGDMEELVEDMDDACAELGRAGFSCNVESGPFVGLTLGASAGVLRQMSDKVGFRGDVTLQYLRFSGPSLKVSDNAGNGYLDSSRWSGTRFWATLGLEF